MKLIEVKFYITVDDPEELARAARKHARDVDKLDEEQINDLELDADNPAECAHMLLDPGWLPGCTIDDVQKETW